MRGVLLAVVGVGCGDNLQPVGQPLGRAADVAIVAHQGDDLLFLQPDLFELARRGSLTNIYVTAGDAAHGAPHSVDASDGLLVAYADATGNAMTEWSCGIVDIAGHDAEHCRLQDANLSLVFLDYPDGGRDGEAPASLLHLWQGDVDKVTTIARRPTTYTRDQLIGTVAEILDIAKPHAVRTLEIAGTHDAEASDHMLVGALTILAVARTSASPDLYAFRGLSTQQEPANSIAPLVQRSREPLSFFEACTTGCAPCGDACADLPAEHDTAVRRRYAVGMRRGAGGVLRTGDGADTCLDANTDGSLRLSPCDAVPHTELAPDGTLHLGERCLSALPTGELVAGGGCAAVPNQRFFLDDEGHVWLGQPPFSQPDMTLQHLLCLDVAGGRPRSSLCGGDHAPTWQLAPLPTATPRPAGLTRTGRAVRLADFDGDRKADLCAVEPGGLRCALGDGNGGFAPATTFAVFPVEPESLVIGDVDDDGEPDACGRTSTGIVCATAATKYTVVPWNPAFAHSGVADASDRSLAAVDSDGDGTAEICGLSTAGVQCARRSLAFPPVLSPWPDRSAALWPGDIDGDRRADWCVATATGAACGRDAIRALSTDGVGWSWSFRGVVEPAPAGTDLGALADIDGDHRDDLCSVRDRAIVCARSQTHGFGPATTIATLPPGPPPVALWLGDLDGDGAADACVDDGATIRCAHTR